MTLEDLIYSALTANETLKRSLAKYGGKPAVFYQSAPDDTATGWKGKKQYPRINYVVDMQSNPERKTSGVLTLDIWAAEDGTPPEDLEPIVRQLFCGVFLQPDGVTPYSLSWARSDAFDSTKEGSGLVVGITMTFDVFAFPMQITTDPDPIMAMNRFIKKLVSESVVIGQDVFTGTYAPTQERPAFYFRLASLQNQRETNTVIWMDAVIAGHIFAAGAETTWMKIIIDALVTDGEVTMMDNSPMFMQNVRADSTLDALSAGQIRISARFGILRRPKYVHTLTKTNIPREIITPKEDVTVNVGTESATGYSIEPKLAGEDEL